MALVTILYRLQMCFSIKSLGPQLIYCLHIIKNKLVMPHSFLLFQWNNTEETHSAKFWATLPGMALYLSLGRMCVNVGGNRKNSSWRKYTCSLNELTLQCFLGKELLNIVELLYNSSSVQYRGLNPLRTSILSQLFLLVVTKLYIFKIII